MPDVRAPAVYSAELKRLVRAKLSDPGFGFRCWSDPDLETLRSFLRSYYRTEQQARCAYCKQQVSLVSASNCHVEHIAPKSLYPEFIFEPKNICVICADCNEIKRGQEVCNETPDTVASRQRPRRYPRSSGAFKIVHPHMDSYFDHIVILRNKIYIDKSPKGSFTIAACKLNRFVHQFGWAAPYTDEAEVAKAMNAFLQEKDAVQRAAALDQLKQILLLT